MKHHLSLPWLQVTVQEKEFLKNQGNKQWLKGIQFLPRKIRNLLQLNKILAHQPWFVKTEHVKVRQTTSHLQGGGSAHFIKSIFAKECHFHSLHGATY